MGNKSVKSETKYNTTEHYCACAHWKYQNIHPDKRKCVHILEHQGQTIKFLKPKVMLFSSNVYKIKNDWFWSEKYDGIRAFWDGTRLLTRGGILLRAPWVLPPDYKLDGEIWTRYNDITGARSVLYNEVNDVGWKDVSFKVFDVPGVDPFHVRYRKLLQLESEYKDISAVRQIKLVDIRKLNNILQTVVDRGGEGLIVRDPLVSYYSGRKSNSGVKLKPIFSGQCTFQGNGTFKEHKTNILFKMKSYREFQPKVVVSFNYNGRTSRGKPLYPKIGEDIDQGDEVADKTLYQSNTTSTPVYKLGRM